LAQQQSDTSLTMRLLLAILWSFSSVNSLSLDCNPRNGENFYLSSRELKCQCEYYDDQTIGQEYFSEIISKSVDTEPQGNPKVSHVILKNCEMIDIVLDLDNLDRNRFQVTDVSFMDVPTLNIMFSELARAKPKLQLVVENSYTTTLSGTLEEYGM